MQSSISLPTIKKNEVVESSQTLIKDVYKDKHEVFTNAVSYTRKSETTSMPNNKGLFNYMMVYPHTVEYCADIKHHGKK